MYTCSLQDDGFQEKQITIVLHKPSPTLFAFSIIEVYFPLMHYCALRHHYVIHSQLVLPEKGEGSFNTSSFSVRIMSSDMQRSQSGG